MDDEAEAGAINTATPNVIRAACRAQFYRGLKHLGTIAGDENEKSADRIRALDTLGRFGLGAADQGAVHIHAGDGAQIIGVVRLPALGEVIEDEVVEVSHNGAQGHASAPPGDLAGQPASTPKLLASGPAVEG